MTIPFAEFPYVPRWLCWLISRHKLVWKYANYNVDISGMRCRCGLMWRDNP